MAECPAKNVTKDSQGEEMQLTSGTIHTKGNVVIFAMDGSEIAIDALKWYAAKCHRPEDVVILVYAVEMSEIFTSAQWLQTPNTEDIDAFQTIFRHQIEKIQRKLQTFAKILRQLGINGSVRSTHAPKPGEGIINVAKEVDATMIVTGSRGHGKIRRTLLGSVSDYLIHHADIPVLVCRHQSFN
ncbi:universal stress protein Sll1388-like [Ostrea edulis]|uniref:universal stress protein Sll1388-like n=1 Tax=Ostrea edulis TaxID=37623 RepID=UPI0024AF24F1|nr:universal stress protein Sll1388-like [Ostrea edulis]